MSAEPVPGPSATVRILPPEEYQALLSVEPFASLGQVPDTASTRIVVAEEGDRIVAYWCIFPALHVEPLWISEEYRHRIGVLRRLWNGVREALIGLGAKIAYAQIGDQDIASVGQQARRLGFEPSPGRLYFVTIDPNKAAPREL